ncbi:hypothetical protein IQ07DRAFT_153291 [Pyrenochaeta sp. DS3sAY3a]|nr:hypothetical protein IQ07DRAFT_153291 [Pyrenochaeta sp. DS3sAY3a]
MPTGSVTAIEPMFTIDPTEKFQIEGPVDEPEDDFDPDYDFDSPDLVKATATPPSKTIFPQIIVPTSTSNNAVEVHILPFHLTITEYCTIDHLNVFKTANVRYVNGALNVNTTMGPKELRYIDHRVPNFKPLRLGYYHFDVSKMYFLYNPQGTPPKGYTWSQCGWADNETWKQCGECRAAQWSGPLVECGLDNLGPKRWSRVSGSCCVVLLETCANVTQTKEMDCSFILGTRTTNEA